MMKPQSMRRRWNHWLAAFLVSSRLTSPVATAAELSEEEKVRGALLKATEYLTSISTEGGYLWRYSEDLSERYGESKATASQIWVQPPGTPSVGMAFLRVYQASGNPRHLAAADAAALALVRGQLESGGWEYRIDFAPEARPKRAYRSDRNTERRGDGRRRNVTTFDDDNTQSALRFLLALRKQKAGRIAEPIREALAYGLAKMIEAQYPNGAWPQRFEGRPHDASEHPVLPARFPASWDRVWPKPSYGAYYTLNDNTQSDCIQTMLMAWEMMDEDRFLAAARRGAEFLVLAQLPEPQPAWAQQYNFRVEPAWARAFEPPAVCSNESAGAVRLLLKVHAVTGEDRFLEPIPRFLAWLKRSNIGPDRWARYYELGTNRPIYGDRDGRIRYNLSEISEERRTGYSWQGSYGIPRLIEECKVVLAGHPAAATSKPRPPSSAAVRRLLKSQKANGVWLNGDWIEMRTMIANMETLAKYLESRRP